MLIFGVCAAHFYQRRSTSKDVNAKQSRGRARGARGAERGERGEHSVSAVSKAKIRERAHEQLSSLLTSFKGQ